MIDVVMKRDNASLGWKERTVRLEGTLKWKDRAVRLGRHDSLEINEYKLSIDSR